MEPQRRRFWFPNRACRRLVAVGCALLLVLGDGAAIGQDAKEAAKPAAAPEQDAPKIPPEQLDSLVAPIALYPDDLLAQTLVASTYPLEIVQLQQWLQKNASLKDKALADAVAKQPWDPSVQSMAAFPDVVKRLADDAQWTTDLGNAFLAQQADVMESVQRMRKKAQDNGALKSNEQQKVDTKTIEDKTVIVVESANPEVIYVPSYSPTVVYGPPVYPYPPIYYPPYPPGAAFVSFSFGVMVGAAFWGGSCCGCGWGGNDVNINVNNNFNQINGGNRGGNNNWQHNPQHRGGTPYSNKATANKYGGSARGDSLNSRQGGTRGQGGKQPTAGSRPSTGAGGARPSAPSAANRSAGGGDQIGSRNIPKSSTSKSSGFSGKSRGYNRSSARANSSRGSPSMGSHDNNNKRNGNGKKQQ